MKHLLHGLERHGLGSRALDEHDFHSICDEEQIDVFWSDKRFAFYFADPALEVKIIVLPKRLSGPRLLFAEFHELGHALWAEDYEPCVAFLGDRTTKGEAEADAIALLAMFPNIDDPPQIMCRFMQRLWEDRLSLYFLYGV